MVDLDSVSYCKIHPPIGIARVGNSVAPDGYFMVPEWPGGPIDTPHGQVAHDDFRYRDDFGRVKRQAARFRIYAYDAENRVLGELTDGQAAITWSAALANKKAAWFGFFGTARARAEFRGEEGVRDIPRRNPGIGKLERRKGGPHGFHYVANEVRARELEIKGATRSVSGREVVHKPDNQLDFTGVFKNRTEVYLGELATDRHGRLIVLGGRGVSRPVDAAGIPLGNPAVKWITNYANNDDWYDDTSDGPITAEVVIKASDGTAGRKVEVRGGAWVVVAPPDYAPDVTNLVTLYDVMEEVALDVPALINDTTPKPRDPSNPDLPHDIWPIVERSAGYRWVSLLGLRGHGQGKPGDALYSGALTFEAFQNALTTRGEQVRDRFLEVLRPPSYQRPSGENPTPDRLAEARARANMTFMPPLSGDEGGRRPGAPASWHSVTYAQYERLQRWRRSHVLDGINVPLPATHLPDKSINPDVLTRSVLDRACGGAFFPGMEVTSIVRDAKLYAEAFRFDHSVLDAGDVTKYMALPWQADFYECRSDWWPAQRPDDVILEDSFKEIFAAFETERLGASFERVLLNRASWERGVGAERPRPDDEFLFNLAVPPTEPEETAANYSERVAGEWAGLFLDAAGGSGGSPWRRQYLLQEGYDTYSGRYYHVVAPDPADVFSFNSIARKHPALVQRYAIKSLADLRLVWRDAQRLQESAIRDSLVAIRDVYDEVVEKELNKYLVAILRDHPGYPADATAPGSAAAFSDVIGGGSVDRLDQADPSEVHRDSALHRQYALIELRQAMIDRLYLIHSGTNGDNAMVEDWSRLGFVVARTHRLSNGRDLTVQVETERDKYDGSSVRDQFYHLMNIQDYPDFHEEARRIAKRGLDYAQSLIDSKAVDDPSHPEAFVPFDETTYRAKLDQIYEIQRLRSQNTDLFFTLRRRNRADELRSLLDIAPYNQCDGSWLRNIAIAGPVDDVRSLLFEIWSDEIGNGDPGLHHGNFFTVLLNSVGFTLYDIKTRAYADDPRIPDFAYANPVFQLAISLHTDRFYPELIGMTLFLEWEVLSVMPGIMRQEYLGVDAQFLRMHVGIDNATNGHGAKARDAVLTYLDKVRADGGDAAVQEHWARIWRGFVAFSVVGGNLFGNDVTIERRRPPNPAQLLAEIIRRKQRYGSQNHLTDKLGGHRINDLFDEPALFQSLLADSRWIVPGNPDASPFLNHLTTFNGPMYKIFDARDIATWREWIEWLGRDGDTATAKRYYEKGEAMEKLLQELRSQAQGVAAHKRFKIDVANGGPKLQIAELFASGDMIGLMRALKTPDNGWVVPGSAADSPLVADMARGGRPMGDALDRRFPTINNRIGRQIVIEWVRAGCPIPGEAPPPAEDMAQPLKPLGPKLFMHTHGMGAVH